VLNTSCTINNQMLVTTGLHYLSLCRELSSRRSHRCSDPSCVPANTRCACYSNKNTLTHISVHQHTAKTLNQNKHQLVALLAASFIQAVLDRGCWTANTARRFMQYSGPRFYTSTASAAVSKHTARNHTVPGWPRSSRRWAGPCSPGRTAGPRRAPHPTRSTGPAVVRVREREATSPGQ
jgi:hypothetical protein